MHPTQQRLQVLSEYLKRDFGVEVSWVRFIYNDPNEKFCEGISKWMKIQGFNFQNYKPGNSRMYDADNVYSYHVLTNDGGFKFLFDKKKKTFSLLAFKPGKKNNGRLLRLCNVNLDPEDPKTAYEIANWFGLDVDEFGFIYPERNDLLVYESKI